MPAIVIHCRDPYVLAPFWSLATGLPIFPEDAASIQTRTLAADESVLLGNRADLRVWVTPAVKLPGPGRIHLDIACNDEERARSLRRAPPSYARQGSGRSLRTLRATSSASCRQG